MSRPVPPEVSHVHPTRDDSVVAALSEVVGGPVGPRAGRARWGTPLAVLLLVTACVFALGMTSKGTCAGRSFDAGNVQFTHLCYSDIPVSYVDSGLDQLLWPWSGDPQVRARYGVTTEPALVGLWEYTAARVTHVLVGSPDLAPRYDVDAPTLGTEPDVLHERVVFTAVNAVGLGVLAMLTTLALSRARRRRPWDAACFAAAPVLALAGLVGFDLISVAAAAGALWAWSRRRPVWAGVAVGLGAGAAVWPALLLPAFALTAWRQGRDGGPDGGAGRGLARVLADVVPASVTALATWTLVNAPAFVTGRAQWGQFWTTATHRGPDAGSVFTVVDETVGIAAGTAHAWSWVLLALWWVAVVLVALWAPVPPRVSQVAFLLVAGVLVLGVVYRPQEALWLLPLAALARPRWRDQLVWQGTEVLWFALYYWSLGGVLTPGAGGQPGFTWIGIGVRLAGTLWLVAVVVRDVWWAEHDPALDERLAGLSEPTGQETTTASNSVVV